MPLLEMNELGEVVTIGFDDGGEMGLREPVKKGKSAETTPVKAVPATPASALRAPVKKAASTTGASTAMSASEIKAAVAAVLAPAPAPVSAPVAIPAVAVSTPTAAVTMAPSGGPVSAAAAAAPVIAAAVKAVPIFNFQHPMEIYGLTSGLQFKSLLNTIKAALASKAA